MKRILSIIIVTTAIMSQSCTTPQPKNILLQSWDTPHCLPPFDQISLEDYKPAIETLMAQGRAQIDSIANNPALPTFANTIEALEYQGQPLERVLSIFYNLNSAATNDSMQALAMELSPLLTQYSNDISLNPLLFARVKGVYLNTPLESLPPEQRTLLENTYKSFVRSGANLSPENQQRYRTITEQISELSVQFEQNLLSATNGFSLEITDSTQLAGLPATVRTAAAEAAEAVGKKGWLITLHAPSYIPFMTYAEDRALREKLYRAYNSRAFGGENNNSQIVVRIANLRLELANILGYKTYADYVLEERMARNVGEVNTLLEELLVKSKSAAQNDVTTIQDYANSLGFTGTLMPWDWSYYTEKYRSAKLDMDEQIIRPYFQLEKVSNAIFMLAERLYGITFVENPSLPTYHPDAHVYEVYDAPKGSSERGELLSILYIDYFPRESKQGGAWMTQYRSAQVTPSGDSVIPIVSLVCNFTKPTADAPSLLSFDELTTLLHEFGHGLHGMFGRGQYPSLTGTSVRRDFVELPSQIMENWASEPEFLDLWATHYQSGEKMPRELIDKIRQTRQFQAPYANVRQLQFGLTDLAWHSITQPITVSVTDFERSATERTALLPRIDGTCFSTSFGHIFSGGYAAGYYSYKWAEVLEADGYEQFRQNGIFDRNTAESFRREILTPGGSRHPMELYVNFAGHEPTPEPLLHKMGVGSAK